MIGSRIIMDLFEKIVEKESKISVVGLGYVGLPLAVAFAERAAVIGFDIDKEKIQLYKNGTDITNEIGSERLSSTKVFFTSDETKLREAEFHIIAVPTPVYDDNLPNLEPLMKASIVVGKNLSRGSIVVYESTVYPGITEELCIPILESESGLKCPEDFKVGYSPERINPGDHEHTLVNTVKIVSGIDEEALGIIASVYELIIDAGVYRAENIRVAEAAKILENCQRDINIAFMNEASIILSQFDIDTRAVLKAANTKWNFMHFTPGLVGGHCIGVDPYYILYKCRLMGYLPKLLSAGRSINSSMGSYVGEHAIQCIQAAGKEPCNSRVAVLGITYKENCPDIRNSRVIDIIHVLEESGVKVLTCDPAASRDLVYSEYGISLCSFDELQDIDLIIVAVPHSAYCELSLQELKKIFSSDIPIILDVKGCYDKKLAENLGYIYWSL